MKVSNIFLSDVRVYIAGVLVPATSVSITTAFNNFPQCQITLPPYAELYGLGRKDKIPVFVFIRYTFVEGQFD